MNGIAQHIKEIVDEELNRLNEGNMVVQADDGPSFMYRSQNIYKKAAQKDLSRYLETGWNIISYLIDDGTAEEIPPRIYPNGPVDSVSFFPAGDVNDLTPNNQRNLFGSEAYDEWKKHILNVIATVGWEWVQSKENEYEDKKASTDAAKDIKKDADELTKKDKEIDKKLKKSEKPMNERREISLRNPEQRKALMALIPAKSITADEFSEYKKDFVDMLNNFYKKHGIDVSIREDNDIKKNEKEETMNESVKPSKTMNGIFRVLNSKQYQKVDGFNIDLTTASIIDKIWKQADRSNKKKLNKLNAKQLAKLAYKMVRKRESVDESYSKGDVIKKGDILNKGKGTKYDAVVVKRNTTGMRGKQDNYQLYLVDKNGKVIKDLGTHPSKNPKNILSKFSESINEVSIDKKRVKIGDRGVIKRVQGPNGKLEKTVKINRGSNAKKYRWNSAYGTYNSIDGNEILTKQDIEKANSFVTGTLAEAFNVNKKFGSKYDIGAGQFPTGTVVWNRKEKENGDYKKLAKIKKGGKIEWYDKSLPSDVKKHIEKFATVKESINEEVTPMGAMKDVIDVIKHKNSKMIDGYRMDTTTASYIESVWQQASDSQREKMNKLNAKQLADIASKLMK